MLDWRGHLAEGTGANIFLAINGELHTPTPDCFLNGITRQTVMGLAKARGIKVVERAIMPEELAKADEMFLTGSAAEVTPVGEIVGASRPLPLHPRHDLPPDVGGFRPHRRQAGGGDRGVTRRSPQLPIPGRQASGAAPRPGPPQAQRDNPVRER